MLFFILKFGIIYMYEYGIHMKGSVNLNKKLLISLTAILLLTGCGTATLKNGEQVVAKMKGNNITADDLYEELKTQGGAVTLTNMVDEFILNKEVKTDDDAKSYAETQIKQYKESYESYGKSFTEALINAGYSGEDAFKDVLILEYKKNKVTEDYVKKNITDDEINKYYKENIYGDIEAKHILISPNTKDNMTDDEKKEAENKAKEEAEKIIKKLDKGEDFEKLAKKNSDDEGTASKGGKLTVTYGSVVDEFWDATLALKDGEYTKEPVKSQYGYHIIYRIKQNEKQELSKVKKDIIQKIVDEKIKNDSTLQTKALVDLRKKYKLEISDSKLKKSYDSSVKSALNANATTNDDGSNEK